MSRAGISEAHGQGLLPDGRAVQVYRALRPLLCSACAHSIKEGELFTRARMEGLSIAPRCRACAPFCEIPESSSARSTLLKSLLEPSPTPKKRAPHVAAQDQAGIRKEIEKRLGPALKRTRRAKS